MAETKIDAHRSGEASDEFELFAIACTVGADLRVGPLIGCTGARRGPTCRSAPTVIYKPL